MSGDDGPAMRRSLHAWLLPCGHLCHPGVASSSLFSVSWLLSLDREGGSDFQRVLSLVKSNLEPPGSLSLGPSDWRGTGKLSDKSQLLARLSVSAGHVYKLSGVSCLVQSSLALTLAPSVISFLIMQRGPV